VGIIGAAIAVARGYRNARGVLVLTTAAVLVVAALTLVIVPRPPRSESLTWIIWGLTIPVGFLLLIWIGLAAGIK
jgi:hypothetical protein